MLDDGFFTDAIDSCFGQLKHFRSAKDICKINDNLVVSVFFDEFDFWSCMTGGERKLLLVVSDKKIRVIYCPNPPTFCRGCC